MIELTTQEIAAAVGGATSVDVPVTGISIDSRTAGPGDLFVALPGSHVDGAAYVDAALAAGAAAAMVPLLVRSEGPLVVVDDPLLALGRVAAEVRRRSQAKVVAITGSTGKTSTKDILSSLVAPRRRTVASRENENNELGVPLTLTRLQADSEVAIVELAMRGLGQIAYLAEIALPHVAVVTSIGPVHLELLGTVERVAEAKAEVLHHLADDATVVVPHGEALLAPHLQGVQARIVTFGDHPQADARLVDFRRRDGGSEAEIALAGRTLVVPVNFNSRHNAINLTAAVAAYDGIGLPVEELGGGSVLVQFSRWRGEELQLPGGGVLIADCYNANPTSMRAAIAHLAEVADLRRRVAVLGDMAELGDEAPRYHREIGELLRRAGVHLVVGVGPLARWYGGQWYATREAVVEALPDLIRPGDAVLVKASRSMGLEEVVEAIAP
jgi:UDP-N-acetylmuramoyl-tripeptide--D-alanyl-D-alanine ligase